MTITLHNGAVLSPIVVMGGKKHVNGATRDALSFVFPVETSLDELDGIFTEDNCKKITIAEGDAEYIHEGYAIRVELKREPVVVTPATDTTDEVLENRVTVTMAQRTYAETQLAKMAAENTDTQLAVAELAEIIMGGI